MERDFLGMGSKNSPSIVNGELPEASKDSVSMRGSGMQWSFPNKVSAIPQFLSFKGAGEEKSRKNVHDPIASSGFMTFSTADAFDSNHRPFSTIVQKNVAFDKQAAIQYGKTSYVVQHLDGYPIHGPQEMRVFPVPNKQNQAVSMTFSTPVPQSHFSPLGCHNLVSNSLSSTPLGGVPIITPPVPVLPNTSPVIGTTELRNGPKSSGAPAQLTIFYAGSVCVYDGISPEKAQAIMSLAGNGASLASNKTLPTARVQEQIARPCAAADGYGGRNKANTSSLCSGLATPIPVTSSCTNELSMVKPVVVSVSSVSQKESPKAVNSLVPASGTLVPTVAVPQARKASLARFLEKRKERVMNTSPYKTKVKSPEPNARASDGMSLSISCSSSFSSPTYQLSVKGGL